MTREELEERLQVIEDLAYQDIAGEYGRVNAYTKQLIRDCIEAVTPEKRDSPDYDDDRDHYKQCAYAVRDLVIEQNETIEEIEANTKELLG